MNFDAAAAEAVYQIEIGWNRSRRDSARARRRWWPTYAAFPLTHQKQAGLHDALMQATTQAQQRRAA